MQNHEKEVPWAMAWEPSDKNEGRRKDDIRLHIEEKAFETILQALMPENRCWNLCENGNARG